MPPTPSKPLAGVHVFDARELPWQDTPEPGLRLKPVRYDDEHGHFLGLWVLRRWRAAACTSTAAWPPASFVDGSLVDFAGADRPAPGGHQLGGGHA